MTLQRGRRWPNYLEKSGLQVDAAARRLHRARSAAGHWPSTPTSSGPAFAGLVARFRAAQPRAARRSATSCRSRSTTGTASTAPVASDPAGYEAFLREIGYLVPEPADFTIETAGPRSRDHRHLRAAARRAGQQRPLRAQRRQRPLGQPLRCALRHRRDPARRRPRAGQGLQSRARRGRRRARRGFPRRGVSAGQGQPSRCHGVQGRRLRAASRASSSTPRPVRRRSRIAASSPATARRTTEADVLLRHNGLHVILVIDRSNPVGKAHPAGLADVVVEAAHDDDPGLRGLRRRGRCRGQGRWSIATGSG